MLKTAASGTTSITNVQAYLMRQHRQEHELHEREWDAYSQGEIQLTERQAGRLQAYLGEGTRGLAVDVSEDVSTRNWARQMDLTRAQYNHDKPTPQGKSRSYYHFILSPDPNDCCTLATMRAYAKEWAEENFRRGGRCCEYAIVYHDDNAKGVLHAHIVVNVTNKATGNKLHLDNNHVVQLQLSAQEIGKRHGLTPLRDAMQSKVGARTTQPVYLDRAEREILNKGGYSWKWELRKFVSTVAPLSSGFDDFRLKLNAAGYDVNRSERTGYLTYTHRNGMKVKDSRLGSRFYLESLEQIFSHEQLLEDKKYASWELIKISKGQIPWKEDIRRAIDAIAPTVVSIPELQQELSDQYGIRLIVNRRGITYQHASGFKVRDESIGLRYTFEGLAQNAVVGMALPYPGYDSILRESTALTKHYLPRSAMGISQAAPELAASRFVYRDLAGLMVRHGLVRIEDVVPVLESKYRELKEEKTGLADLRNQVMRWNHLAVLESRYEKDVAFLREGRETADPDLYNEALIRSERIGLYLKEQSGGYDIQGSRKAFTEAYDERLDSYQERLGELNRDMTIYQNYLMGKNVRSVGEVGEEGLSVDAQALFAAGRTLAKYRIRDFFHLEQTVFSQESRLELVEFKLNRAAQRKRELDQIQADIRTVLETKPCIPAAEALAKTPVSLGLETIMLRYEEASSRLDALGIREEDFPTQHAEYQEAVKEHGALIQEQGQIQLLLQELHEAQEVCLAVARTVKDPLEPERIESEKPSGSGGGQDTSREEEVSAKGHAGGNETREMDLSGQGGASALTAGTIGREGGSFEALPIEEARRRRQERLRQAPERSVKLIWDDLER